MDLYEEDTLPSKAQVRFLTWVFRAVILAILPSAVFIYRSRLLSMVAFKRIKMHQGHREGIAYSRWIEVLNYLFIVSGLRKLNYIEYITFKNKNKYAYELLGETSAYIILLLVIFFRSWNSQIEPF